MVTMRDAFPPTNAAAVDRLQRQLGLQLPAAYRAFLLRYNGGAPDRKEFFVASRPQNPIEHIHYFFGIDVPEPTLELSSAINFYEGGIPREILPVASDGTGSYLCLDLRNSANRVAFWDHRHFWGTGEWREQDLYQVAPSFEVFLTMLRPATI